MTDLIDYSRPVGWWCPVCTRIALLPNGTTAVLGSCCFVAPPRGIIPVYLPIPEGQRPPAASEVEEAEVVIAEHYGDVRVFSGADQGPDGTGRNSQRWALAWDTEADQWDLHGDCSAKTIMNVPLAVAINYIVTGATE